MRLLRVGRLRRSTWAAPGLLAVAATLGLVAGLLGDGAWDMAAWHGLGLPVAVCAVLGLQWRSGRAG